MLKNILITGAHGQLGKELQQLTPDYPNFHFLYTDIESLDLSDQEQLMDFFNLHIIDYVINCAAYTAVDQAEDEEELCYRINRDGITNLATAVDFYTKIIHISTDYVFDGHHSIPYVESDRVNPQSVYGKSKRQGEINLFKLRPDSIIIRTSWLYSSYGKNFVNTILRLGREKETLHVVNDQLGAPTYAADLARAILDIIVSGEKETRFVSGFYHYSNEGMCSWYGFAQKIIELAGISSCTIVPITTAEYPVRATRPMYSVLNKTKIKNTFRLSIPDWEESLKVCMSRIIKQEIK